MTTLSKRLTENVQKLHLHTQISPFEYDHDEAIGAIMPVAMLGEMRVLQFDVVR